MNVVRMEAFLQQRNNPWRDEPYFRDDERLVARCLAASVLGIDRRCAPLAHMVAIHSSGLRAATSCRAPGPRTDVARPVGSAAETVRPSTRVPALRTERMADPRRHARQADLGARQRLAGRVRRDLPLGDRTDVRRARLGAYCGLPAAGAQPLWPHAGLCARHGGRTAVQQRAPSRVVGSDAPLTHTGLALRLTAARRAPAFRGRNNPSATINSHLIAKSHTTRRRHGI
jgi:hypothetical protein